MSVGDGHHDHDQHHPPQFYDDQPGSKIVDDGEDDTVEIPEYVSPDDVPLDDPAAKVKAARYEDVQRMFNKGKGACNRVSKVHYYTLH